MTPVSVPPSPSERSPSPEDRVSDPRLAAAVSALADPSVAVLSVDVFDTLVWRAVPEPVDVFVLLGERLAQAGRLAPGVGALGVARLRRAAEHRARERRGDRGAGTEVTLAEIWAEFPAHVLVRVDPAELVAGELALESELLRPDLEVLALVRLARASGRQVVALSDTYLTEVQVREVVLSRAPLTPDLFDRVLVSSAHGHGKGSGMFTRLLSELAVEAAEVVHVGDHANADVAAAAGVGLRAVHFERRPAALDHALRYEDAFGAPLDPQHGDHGLTALRAKAIARAPTAEPDPALRPLWRWGAGHAGPVFWGFAGWVRERAVALGVERVHCFMREGELLARLIEDPVRAGAPSITASRLWVSRQVLARASLREGSREELSRLVRRRRAPTVRELCTTLGIAPGTAPRLDAQADARLNDFALRDWVLDVISADAALRAGVVDRSAQLRERVVRHVLGALGDGVRTLVTVDVGWGATSQGELQRLLDEAGADVLVHGLYLITHKSAVARVLDGVRAEAFLAGLGDPIEVVDTITRSPELLEQVCMPDHGTQLGFDEHGEPVLATGESDPVQLAQRETAQRGIFCFAHEWRRYDAAVAGGLAPLHQKAAPRLLAIAARALSAPTLEEAECFGSWLHEDNFGSEDRAPIASAPSAQVLSHMDPKGLIKLSSSDLYWPFGLAAIHDADLERALTLVSMGLIGWDAFSSDSDAGSFEILPDLGKGFEGDLKSRLRARRNRRGLSYVRGTVHGDGIDAIRLDPVEVPALFRIDWLTVRCSLQGRSEPEVLRFEHPEDFAPWQRLYCDELAPKVYLSTGADPQLHLDLRLLFDRPVYFVDVECAYASVALPVLLDRAEVIARAEHVRRRYPRYGDPDPLTGRQIAKEALTLVRRRLVARIDGGGASD